MEILSAIERTQKKEIQKAKRERQKAKRLLNDQFDDVVKNDAVNPKLFIEKVHSMIEERLVDKIAKFNFYNLSFKYIFESWSQKFEAELIEHKDKRTAIETELQRIEMQFYGFYYYPSKRDYYKDATKKSKRINTIKEKAHLLDLLEDIFLDVAFAVKFVHWSFDPNTAYAMVLDVLYYVSLRKELDKYTPSVSKPKTDEKQTLARHWALFFAYLHPSVFDVKPTIEQFCKDHNANVKPSNVRQHYYKGEYNNPKKRAIQDNKNDILFVIEHFLKDYPNEKAIAENEIKDFK